MALWRGTVVPDFTVETDAGTKLSASDLRGQTTVFYFYPRADTSG